MCLILFLADLVIDIDDLSDVSYDFGMGENRPFQKPAEGRQTHLDVPPKSPCSLLSKLFAYLLCL